MPIIAASEVDQSGTSITAAISPTSAPLMPRPVTATRIGSPAATTEPNTSSRITAAAARPRPSEPMLPCSALCTGCPPTARVSPGRCDWSVSDMIRCVSAIGMSCGFATSSRMVARAVRPSAATSPGELNGSVVPVTCGTVRTCRSRSVTAARTAGSVTGPSERTARSIPCPASAGNRWPSRSCAVRESEPRAV